MSRVVLDPQLAEHVAVVLCRDGRMVPVNLLDYPANAAWRPGPFEAKAVRVCPSTFALAAPFLDRMVFVEFAK